MKQMATFKCNTSLLLILICKTYTTPAYHIYPLSLLIHKHFCVEELFKDDAQVVSAGNIALAFFVTKLYSITTAVHTCSSAIEDKYFTAQMAVANQTCTHFYASFHTALRKAKKNLQDLMFYFIGPRCYSPGFPIL